MTHGESKLSQGKVELGSSLNTRYNRLYAIDRLGNMYNGRPVQHVNTTAEELMTGKLFLRPITRLLTFLTSGRRLAEG